MSKCLGLRPNRRILQSISILSSAAPKLNVKSPCLRGIADPPDACGGSGGAVADCASSAVGGGVHDNEANKDIMQAS